jgi:hypothetical protein
MQIRWTVRACKQTWLDSNMPDSMMLSRLGTFLLLRRLQHSSGSTNSTLYIW